MSIGFGDTSDLGLTARYEDREVHYKNGDFDWAIQPTEYVHKVLVNTEGGTNTYETVTDRARENEGSELWHRDG